MIKHLFPPYSVISYASSVVDVTEHLYATLRHTYIELLTRDHNGS